VSLYPGVPYEYSSAAGGLVFIAGACPLDSEGRVVSGGLKIQVNKAVDNLLAVLEREGLTTSSLVKTTIFVASGKRADLVEAWRIVERRLAPARPASTLLGVTALGYPDQLFEIEAVASRMKDAERSGPEEK
jgi:enamine deaminase RidA (YjgF/YER057c/UK114 family)